MAGLQDLAAFVHGARHEQIGAHALEQLKIRILDALGVAIGAPGVDVPDGEPATRRPNADEVHPIHPEVGSSTSTLHRLLMRPHLDFGDVYLARNGICHPSENVGPVLLAADRLGASGRDFITALAVAYQVDTRVADARGTASGLAPAVDAGWAVEAAVSKLQGLDATGIADAIARPAAAARNRVNRTPWPNRLHANPADGADVGQSHGRDDVSTAPAPVAIDWSREGLESVLESVARTHYADVRAQSSIEAALTIATPPVFRPSDGVRAVRVRTFQAAYDAIGGGDGEDRYHVQTEHEAAGSLPYMVAVALLDQQVQPPQYALGRVVRADVQALLRNVSVAAHPAFTADFPAAMRAQIDIELADGTRYCASTLSCSGSPLRPWDWSTACEKFHSLVAPCVDDATAARIAYCVRGLESRDVRELTGLLARVSLQPWRAGSGLLRVA